MERGKKEVRFKEKEKTRVSSHKGITEKNLCQALKTATACCCSVVRELEDNDFDGRG